MKSVAVIALVVVSLAVALPRMKRQAFFLPDGVELIVGNINTNFNCDGLRYGYYADVDNNCQIFHVCHPITHADGNQETLHYSFFCGNQTVFNQLTLTCAFPEDAVPCQNARDFYYVNDNIGIEDALFLRDEDVARAQQLIQGKKK
ncbi:chitin-binding type-2 domain-containing protein [Trichonephila clavata]|uniref:Chitin-binding type-2 domain-containing protein n=1 Tax=Trichonephila clavata TaxID=2740835 RepID=A0A8X6L5A0_TRICU|nr:chitin-binding type-2 domain-containing protein [Trichonephila clavata]